MSTPLTLDDPMPPWPARALHITLDRPGTPPEAGHSLPPFAHHVYFLEATPAGALGRDGHPGLGGFIPDIGLPRRMWAGGRLEWHRPVILGNPACRISCVETVEQKTGRSGPLAFVTVRHEIWQSGALRITEWQDLVYREDPTKNGPTRPPPLAPDGQKVRDLSFDSTVLFRYSALTFNGHRIHYDVDYARSVEGYDGLVVHGPLLAQHLMIAANQDGPLRKFQYRAHAPVTLGMEVALHRQGSEFWVAGATGHLHLSGHAEW